MPGRFSPHCEADENIEKEWKCDEWMKYECLDEIENMNDSTNDEI